MKSSTTSTIGFLPQTPFCGRLLFPLLFLLPWAASAQSSAFITTWKTDNLGTSNSSSITIPTTGGGYNYDADWNNDGTYDQTGITGDVTHDFGAAGTYTIRIRGSFPRIYFNIGGDRQKLLGISQWGTIAWTSMASAFGGCLNLNISATDVPNLSGVTDMSFMFSSCTVLNGPANIGTWNTAAVTNMNGMFSGANSFNQPIGNWNTAAVTNMSRMFLGFGSFNQPIGNWNTAAVTNMSRMFFGNNSFDQPIGNWNTANVTDMEYMFGLTDAFNQPIGNWNTAAVTNMSSMFASACAFNQPIGTWNTAAVTNMSSVFQGACAFNQPIGTWNTAAATSMYNMFYQAYAFNQPIGNWNTAAVTEMDGMFYLASSFNQPIGNWNTALVTDMRSMFDGASAFNQPIGNWNTVAVTNMSYMFSQAYAFNQPIGTWNTAAVTYMHGMFSEANSFNQPIGNWTLNASVYLANMLDNCGMDCSNYSTTLIGWSNNPATPNGRTLGASGRQYGTNAVTARNTLTTTKTWTITGDAASGTACLLPDAFITTWKTDNPGTSNSTSITIPTTGTGYNYDADWNNDGTYDQTGITGDVTHDFGAAGTYTIRIRGSFPRIYFNNSGDRQKLLGISQWGTIGWTSMARAFAGCSNLNISATDVPNLSGATDMSLMFSGCTVLNGPANIGTWNTATVTDMREVFANANAFNQPIGNWNTAAVTNMSSMFYHAVLFNQPIGNWNTAAVTDMGSMVAEASSFNQPIGNWSTAAVTNMRYMFTQASSFNQPIGNWNTAAVTDMEGMFYLASSFNQPIGNWNTAAVTDMGVMFSAASAFNQPLGTWALNASVIMNSMLNNCGMDCANYGTTLIGWSNNPATPNGRTLGAIDRRYDATAVAARTNLTTTKSWTITGDAQTTSAAAGPDQTGSATCGLTQVTLAANSPAPGTGAWSVVSGTGGSFGSTTSPTSTFSGNTGATYTLRWTVTDAPCTSTDDVVITFNQNPTVGCPSNMSAQVSDPAFALSGATPTGGTYSGTGVSSGMFNPATAGGGTHTITYSFTNAAGCSGTCTFTITVNTTTCPSNSTVCITDAPFALTGGTPAGGTYSGTGVSGGQFNPATAGAGTHTITYTNGASCTFSITVRALPTAANAGSDQTGAATCGQTSVTLAANTPTIGSGTWSIQSGTGGSLGTPSSPTSTFSGNAGATYTLRWTVTNSPCAASTDDVSITFTQNPTPANAGDDATVCGTSTNLAGNTPAIGTGTWTQVSGPGTATFGVPGSPTSSVSVSATGAYTFRWTIANAPCAASTDDVVITFNASSTTVANAGPDQTGAATCGLTQVTLAGNTATVGTGAWSVVAGTGGSFGSTASPTSTFSGNAGATYTLRWTISNPPCSPSTDDVMVTFNQNPTAADAGSDQTSNATCGLTQVTLAGNTPSVGTGSWSVQSGTGGSFGNASSPTSMFSGAAGNTYTLRWTVTNSPCAASTDEVTVTFNQAPSFSACPPGVTVNATSGCSATATYTATAASTTPAATVAYAFGGATTGSGSGTGSGQAFNLGTTTVSLTATNSCGSSGCSFSIVVQAGEINVQGNGTDIADGDNSPSAADHTDFGQTNGPNIVRTFTVQNIGTASLPVTGITLGGADPGQFSVGALTPPSPVPAGQSATFAVTYAPTAAAVHNATVNVASGDCDEAAYDFAVRGELTCTAPTFTACPTGPLTAPAASGQCSAALTYAAAASGLPAPALTYAFTGATSGSSSGTGSGANFNTGSTTVTVTATNPCGAPTCSFTVTVTDTQNPSIVCPGNISKNTDANQCTAVATYASPTHSDNCSGAALTRTSGPASGSAFPKGTTMVEWKVTDGAGLSSVCQFTVTVADGQYPTATCPPNITKSTDAGQCTAVTTFASATATDNCAGVTVAQSGGPDSGTAFPKGATQVKFKATDEAGRTKECAFTVTVNDTQQPTATCPANITRNNDAGNCSALVTYSVGYSDNCPGGGAAMQSGLASGQPFPKGQTTVTWRATDAMGLTKTCSFRVTVNDVELPTITCPGSLSLNTEANLCSALATYTTPTATDNCTVPPPTVVKTSGLSSGSAFPKGTNTVVWKATDGAGLTKTCSFTVTVTDVQLPSITCPSNVAVTAPPGQCSATVIYTNPTATDNCSITSSFLLSGLSSGSIFPQGVTTNVWRAIDNSGGSATCAFTVTVACGTGSIPMLSGSGKGAFTPLNQEHIGIGVNASRPDGVNAVLPTLHLAPNPATTEVQVFMEGLGESGDITVYDAQGRMMWQHRIGSETLTSETLTSDEQMKIALDDRWQTGVYMVVLRSGSQVATKRLVVTR